MSTALVGTALDADQARRLTDSIKTAVAWTWDLVQEAYFGRAWEALGYLTWDAYCEAEFGTSRLRLPREERSEVVGSLRDAGLSLRAIAAGTGLSKDTVARELAAVANETPGTVTGTDGKVYPSERPEPPDDLDARLERYRARTDRLLATAQELAQAVKHSDDLALVVQAERLLSEVANWAAVQELRTKREAGHLVGADPAPEYVCLFGDDHWEPAA